MFKISIEQIESTREEEILVRCHEINNEVLGIIEKLKSSEIVLPASRNGEMFRVAVKDIYYAESVDKKTFLCLQKNVLETKLKLYEIEEKTFGTKLFRCSKSMILNAAKIRSVSASVNGRFEAKLINGEVVIISRQYVSNLKKILGM